MKLSFSLTLVLFFVFGGLTIALSQPYSSNKKAFEAYKKAESYLNIHKKEEAIGQLKLAIQRDPTFVLAIQQLADLYRLDKKYRQAIPLYKEVLNLNAKLSPLTYFGLGESLLTQGQYKSALFYLNEYAKGNLSDKGRNLTNKYIQDCEFALKQNLEADLKLIKLPQEINTLDNEYFPKLTVDSHKIIFTRKTDNLENFYESTFNDNKWSKATKLTGDINSQSFNEGAHCISLDGKYLFFTGCNRPEGLGSCDIYVSKLENGYWQSPKNLGPNINSKYWESQPAISADGRTLYFTSNRPGGYGGYDIWKSELQENKEWSAPINLGKNINTSFDEGSTFIHADNKTLYFASTGWPGFGQQDLFFSTLQENGSWSLPTNLGYPINNSFIQNSIQITVDGKYGFLSSQDTSNQLDIYSFIIPKEIKPNTIAYIQGYVYDKETNKPLSSNISITNTKTNEIVFKTQADHTDGSFLATLPTGSTYAFHIQKKGYLFLSKQYNFESELVDENKFTERIFLSPIKTGQSIQLNNLFFDTDKYDLLPESYTELQILSRFLKENATLIVEISGHTDNTGTGPKNQILSERRANAVKKYLIENGISNSRITTMGYADQQPVADNSTAAGRRLNRRTEIKIL